MNPNCPRCGACGSVKHGSYLRRDDAQIIQGYHCVDCGKNHSSATHTDTYRQKRRRLPVRNLAASLPTKVAPIPASGQMAPRSAEKYGKLRDNIKRLTRKTWCITKRAEVLDDVIAIYMHFLNTTLVA